MNKYKTLGIIGAALGLVLTSIIFIVGINFFRTMQKLASDNPSVVSPRDTFRVNTSLDTLVDVNAALNQKIAEKLVNKKDAELEAKQSLLHTTVMSFVDTLDIILAEAESDEISILRLKNAVNRTNLAFRAALFNVNDANGIDALNSFIIIDEKKIENTIFECFLKNKDHHACTDLIKHQALYLESIILEKNFNQLKT